MLRKDAKLDLLRRVPLFERCTKGELQKIAGASDELDVPAGKTLTREGRTGYEFLVLVEGAAEVRRKNRVVNTPISEGTVMGLAIGAAAVGLRPIVEIMFIDFITLAMDQLVNHAAKLHYMSGGQLKIPLTVRVQCGISGNMGAHHSQSLESWLAHVPGLKVVMPSNPADAKGLIKTAIRDDNPVVFIEHRGLYWTRGVVPEGEHLVPIGKAAVAREGDHLTIVATAKMLAAGLEAAEELSSDGISVEVIDPRTLSPLDA